MIASLTTHTGHPRPLTVNEITRTDPTRTLTIRRRFEAEAVRRFRALKADIRASIVDNDCFGLEEQVIPTVLEAATRGQFAFARAGDKVSGFIAWLNEQEEAGILERVARPRVPRITAEPAWTDIYVQSAYQKGMVRARQEMRKQGMTVPSFDDMPGGVTSAMLNQPFHVERVGLLFTRTFSELKGIDQAMDQQISRILAEGLLEGRNPKQIARTLNDRVDKIGITRARTMARTEVVRAHHLATINEYRSAGIDEVVVQVEWLTSGFDVCPICKDLEGKIFTLDQIEGMIPVHPNCRCCAIPAKIGERPEERLAGARWERTGRRTWARA